MVSQVVSSSNQGSHMPEITGICCAALQMRPRPVFPVMTSSLVPKWNLKGAVPERGLCTAGMPGCAPWWPCAQLLLCQTWSKCSDDKIVRAPFFFLHNISSLQWQSHLFPPQAVSWWMPGFHRHSHHVWNIKSMKLKGIRNLYQLSWVSEAFYNAVSNGRSLHRGAHSKDHT